MHFTFVLFFVSPNHPITNQTSNATIFKSQNISWFIEPLQQIRWTCTLIGNRVSRSCFANDGVTSRGASLVCDFRDVLWETQEISFVTGICVFEWKYNHLYSHDGKQREGYDCARLYVIFDQRRHLKKHFFRVHRGVMNGRGKETRIGRMENSEINNFNWTWNWWRSWNAHMVAINKLRVYLLVSVCGFWSMRNDF